MRGQGRIYLRGNLYWICYYLRGKQFRESAGTSDPKQAQKMLNNRMREIGADVLGARPFTTPRASKLAACDLLAALKADYVLRGKNSGQNISHLKRAEDDFGENLAVALTAEKIDSYAQARLAKGDKPASINRALQLLRRSYPLAIRRNHLSRAPFVRRLSEAGNTRQGFCEQATFAAIRGFLPNYLQDDFCAFAYITGMRFGEIRSLAWANVKGDEIELQAADAKNRHARTIPMLSPDLAGILKRRKEARTVKRNGTVQIASLIFHHNGNPILDCRKAWKTACTNAGASNLLFHDLRRSAVRNLDRAHVSRDVAMSITGHRTQSMFSRYNIVATDDVANALKQVVSIVSGS